MRVEEAKDADRVRTGCRQIAREISESAYIWDTEGDGNTEIFGIRDKVE